MSSEWSVMTCPWTCQHMTPSTAIEGSKTFSLALCQKSLAEHCVRVVHFVGTPLTQLLRFKACILTLAWKCQKSLAEHRVRVVHFVGTPLTQLLRFKACILTLAWKCKKILGRAQRFWGLITKEKLLWLVLPEFWRWRGDAKNIGKLYD